MQVRNRNFYGWWLVVARGAAFEAVRVIRALQSGEMAITDKGDGRARDLKTVADEESEKIIKLLLETPPHGEQFAFYGEETHALGEKIDPEVPTWIVDPIDGTTNFAGGIPVTAISIALWHKGRPILGLVSEMQDRDGVYTVAEEFFPASYREHPIHVSACTSLTKALVGFDWPHKDESRTMMMPVIHELLAHGRNVRVLGCAVQALCLVASGGLDAYVNDELFPWDYAAASLLVTNAGGRVSDRFDEPLTLASRSIIASAPGIHDELVALVRAKHL